jgi:hypothetical protein
MGGSDEEYIFNVVHHKIVRINWNSSAVSKIESQAFDFSEKIISTITEG